LPSHEPAHENVKMVGKLAVSRPACSRLAMRWCPLYKAICEMTGINILSLSERQVPGNGVPGVM
jgi:cytochrome c oxidase assembly protein subunit 11